MSSLHLPTGKEIGFNVLLLPVHSPFGIGCLGIEQDTCSRRYGNATNTLANHKDSLRTIPQKAAMTLGLILQRSPRLEQELTQFLCERGAAGIQRNSDASQHAMAPHTPANTLANTPAATQQPASTQPASKKPAKHRSQRSTAATHSQRTHLAERR